MIIPANSDIPQLIKLKMPKKNIHGPAALR
jgi:hypothetical protein